MKKNTGGRKARQQRKEKIFFGALIALLILIVVLTVIQLATGGSNSEGVTYVVTEDGHVHTADGLHVGTVDEFFGENGLNVTITEDGHVHGADGSHLGFVNGTETGEGAVDSTAAEATANPADAAE